MDSYDSYHLQLPDLSKWHQDMDDEHCEHLPHDPALPPPCMPFTTPLSLEDSCKIIAFYSLAPMSMEQAIQDEGIYQEETPIEENNIAHQYTAYDGVSYGDYDDGPEATCYETTQDPDYTLPALGSPSSTYSGDSADSEDNMGSSVDTTTALYGSNMYMSAIPENTINFNFCYGPVYDENNNQLPCLFDQDYQNDYYDEDGNLLKQPQVQLVYNPTWCRLGCNCSMCVTVQEGNFYYPNDMSQGGASTNDYSQYNTPENFSGSEFIDQPTVPSSPLLNESDLPAPTHDDSYAYAYYCSQNEESLSTIPTDTNGGIC